MGVGKRGHRQLSWPLAGRVITLLLLLKFTIWAVVLTMRLLSGCPINLAFGGFPRWSGRSYLRSVERRVQPAVGGNSFLEDLWPSEKTQRRNLGLGLPREPVEMGWVARGRRRHRWGGRGRRFSS